MQRRGVPVRAPHLALPRRALHLVNRVHQHAHACRALLDALQPPEDVLEGEVGVPVIEPNGRPRERGLHPPAGVVVGAVVDDEVDVVGFASRLGPGVRGEVGGEGMGRAPLEVEQNDEGYHAEDAGQERQRRRRVGPQRKSAVAAWLHSREGVCEGMGE